MLKEYRCTRSRPYGPGTAGFRDPSAREGTYIVARSPQGARDEMRRRFASADHDLPTHGRPFYTVEEWKDAMPWATPVEDQRALSRL